MPLHTPALEHTCASPRLPVKTPHCRCILGTHFKLQNWIIRVRSPHVHFFLHSSTTLYRRSIIFGKKNDRFGAF